MYLNNSSLNEVLFCICLKYPCLAFNFPQAKHGFTNLTGIDYSTSAVRLSNNILEKEGLSNVKVKVTP